MSVRTVRSYYRAIDEKRYKDLEALLAPDFVHERPDRTFEGRETFVVFMRDDRPRTETSHELDRLYDDGDEIAVRGRLLDDDGERLFGFVDVHTIEDGSIARIETYTD
jgi:ketosteroid isomerase-like protein